MTNVIGLRGHQVPNENGSEPSVIELLEDILKEAKNGEIKGIGIVAIRPNLQIGTFARFPGGRHYLVAGCEYLKSDLVADTQD